MATKILREKAIKNEFWLTLLPMSTTTLIEQPILMQSSDKMTLEKQAMLSRFDVELQVI